MSLHQIVGIFGGGSSGGASYDDTELRGLVAGKIDTTSKGVANGVASLDANGLIPSAQLPSYVDDVLEFANLAAFPATGETGKIYVSLANNLTYRWSGTAYVKITSGEVSSVAGRIGVVVLTKADVGLGNVDNTADSAKNVLSATKWNTARTISFVGGATGSGLVDGTQNVEIELTVDLSTCVKTDDARITTWNTAATNSHTHANKAILDATSASYTTALDTKLGGIATGANNYTHPNSGATAGTYRSVTVNAQGHITAGTNPTTVSGYGLTDVYTKTEVDAFITALSDRVTALETP